ncbi:MAG: NAD(+) diphosphatase [Nocardioidaceae bacterium]
MTAAELPDFPFRRSLHDRLAESRSDEAFLDKSWADSGSRVVVMHGNDLAAEPDGTALAWISPADAPPGDRLLLGEAAGIVHFAVLAAPVKRGPVEVFDDISVSLAAGARQATLGFSSLRRLATRLSDLDASFAVHAAALAGWHRKHPRCSVCGAQTRVAQAGAVRTCPQCSTDHFPRTDPAVIMTVVDDEGRCLLGHNAARPAGWFSTLAGFVEPGESPEEAVAREVAEEVGVVVDSVRYLGSQPWPFPSSLMLGFEAHASSTEITVDGAEITEARWFTRDELRHAVAAGQVGIPTTISIAGALLTRWYGADLPPNVLEL